MVSASSSGGLPVAYCTRRAVLDTLGFQVTSQRRRREIYTKILAASRRIESRCNRYFYPNQTTETFDWPTHQYEVSWRMWLDEREMAALPDQVLSAGTDITSSVLMRPDQGPPFTNIEINLATQAAFNSGVTYQRAIDITGLFGFTAAERSATALAAGIGTTDTVIMIENGAELDAGDTIHIDAERMLVTDTRMVATGLTLTADLPANNGAVLLSVSDPSQLNVDEYLMIDGERFWISDITSQVIARRALDGSVLAQHSSGAQIFAERGLVVRRGQLGTMATTHANAAPIAALEVPDGIRNWCSAEACVNLLAERTGFAAGSSSSMSGSGSSASPTNIKATIGAALEDYRKDAINLYARQLRIRTAERLI